MKISLAGILIGIILYFGGFVFGAVEDMDHQVQMKQVEAGFVFVSGGCFEMGETHELAAEYERPVHEVCVSDFYIGKHEVTVGEFKVFVKDTGYKTEAEKGEGCLLWMGKGWRRDASVLWNRPGFLQTDRHPVSCVSWNDVSEFVVWKRRKTGLPYRLPTEAEWEYAARAGGKPIKSSIAGHSSRLEEYAWFRGNSGGQTHAIGQKKPNGLGLYDMSGNVWEWVQDWYGGDYYQQGIKNDPQGPDSGKGRVMRGGSWYVISKAVGPAHRNWTYPHKRYNSLGFRLSL